MKKKLILISSILLLSTTLSAVAQSVKGKNEATYPIVSANDSLSYAFGANLAMQGLKQHLTQLGIVGDTAEIERNYKDLIEKASTSAEKERLDAELKMKLDSVKDETTRKTDLFLKGLTESLPAKGANSAYIVGLSIGDQIYKMATEMSKTAFEDESADNINLQLTIDGVKDVLLEKNLRIDYPDVIVNQKMKEGKAREDKLKEKEFALQIEEGKRFLENNKLQDGVTTLPSGLQYKVLVKGDGDIPKSTDRVKVHYRGTLLDGTEFDSSYARREPITLGVGQVIAGWTQALQIMPVGSKWMLYIPYDLAYGERNMGTIPPYSNLIFEIELLGIE